MPAKIPSLSLTPPRVRHATPARLPRTPIPQITIARNARVENPPTATRALPCATRANDTITQTRRAWQRARPVQRESRQPVRVLLLHQLRFLPVRYDQPIRGLELLDAVHGGHVCKRSQNRMRRVSREPAADLQIRRPRSMYQCILVFILSPGPGAPRPVCGAQRANLRRPPSPPATACPARLESIGHRTLRGRSVPRVSGGQIDQCKWSVEL